MPSGFTTGTARTGGSGFTSTATKATGFTSGATKELDLEALARKANISIPEKKPKLSFLDRLGAGLGAFETGEAVATGLEKGVGAGIGTYIKGIGKGLASAVTGRDLGQTEKRFYKDILEDAGIENKVAKYGLGFIGDVLLDPTTYFGGAIAKGMVKGTKIGTSGVLKGIGKIAPKAETGIRLAGEGVKEALGKAFKFGYGTTKGLPEKTLEIQNQIAKAKEGIVYSNMKRLGTGTLSESQQEELVAKMLAGKRAEFAGKTAEEATDIAKSTDPLVQKTIQEQIQRTGKFAKAADIDDPYTVYFPGIAKDKLKKFVEGTKNLRVGSEGYKKEFKNLLKDEELIRSPVEAFARREFEIAKDSIVRSQLNSMVKEFGKSLDAFKNADEALKAGFQAVKEKGIFGKEIGYLSQVDKKFIDNLINPEFTTIDAIAKYTGFDAMTSLFKRSVTGLFAPFHVRNYVSGNIQNYEVLGAKVLSPRNIALGQRMAYKLARNQKFGADDILELAGKKHNLNDVMAPFDKRFGRSSQYISDIGDATREIGITGELFGKVSLTETIKTLGLGQQAIPFRIARGIGNFIETQQKAIAYITALRGGKSVKEALDLAARAGFDYRALTGFESKVLRRLIPFYSFTRKNIELQLTTLGESPERINNVLKLVRNLTGELTPEEKEKLPQYAKEQFAIKTGETIKELPEIAVGLGTPIEQFAQLFFTNKPTEAVRKMAATLNPIFKVPLERAFNKDFFRDRPLSEVIEAGEYAKAPQWVKDFLQAKEIQKDVYINNKKTGEKRIVVNANPYRLQLLRSLPTTRGATYLSAIFAETSDVSKALNLLTGIKPRPIDLETVEYFRDRDRQKELEDLLIRAGVLKRFEKTYKPKP